ncbi:MAG: DUF1559 domain-containing protein [Planctomycetota bacterium]
MNRRTAFSLTELMITIACTSIVFSLALPHVQQQRENARTLLCERRLTQVGLDALDFEDRFGLLPAQLGEPGVVFFGDWTSSFSDGYFATNQYASPLARITAANEPLRIAPEFTDASITELEIPYYELIGWDQLLLTERPEFRCPSDQLDPLNVSSRYSVGVQPIHYGEIFHQDYLGYLAGELGVEYGYTNFVGCLGASTGGSQRAESGNPDSLWRYRGLMTSREKVNSAFVFEGDGMSSTIMFGENIGSVEQTPSGLDVSLRQSWMGGALARGRGTAHWMTNGNVDNPMLGSPDKSSNWGFGSAHRNKVNFVMGDGAIRPLDRSIDWLPYYQMCGAYDTWE